MKNNPLSDIYSQKVLLNEEKTPVVKGAKELESKIGKAGLVANQGPEKSKKDIETPEENFAYFLALCVKSDNALNRDELRVMTNQLQQLA